MFCKSSDSFNPNYLLEFFFVFPSEPFCICYYIGSFLPVNRFAMPSSQQKGFHSFHCLKSSKVFLCFFLFSTLLQRWGFHFAHARGSPTNVSGHVKSSQYYTKVEHVKTRFLDFSPAKIPTVLINTVFWIAFYFHIHMVWAIVCTIRMFLFTLGHLNREVEKIADSYGKKRSPVFYR